jgi:RNA polymerase sigma-70 factor (sigma-E family)
VEHLDPANHAMISANRAAGGVLHRLLAVGGVTMSDVADFEEFIVARGDALLRFALMLCGDPHRAEDLVQSVLAKTFPRWERVAAMDRPEAYLKTILVHDHLRWWRRRSAGEVPMAEPAGSPGPRGGRDPADDPAVRHASQEATWDLLRRLPQRQRAVLVLRYYEDLTDDQIAQVLTCTPSTVRSQAARALATLRRALPTVDKEALP